MDYLFAFVVFFIICVISIFTKKQKTKESHNNNETVSKIVNTFISYVCNNRMLTETKYLYISNLFTPTNERYMMYTAASNIINDFKNTPFLFLNDVKSYSSHMKHMKKMYIFFNNFENVITNYVNNNDDDYIKKGIVSKNLKKTISKCIEKYYIDQFYSNNPEFYYYFFNFLVYDFQTF